MYDIGFTTIIMRSNIDIGNSGRTSYVLIGCEMSVKYMTYKKDLVQIVNSSRKCGCPYKL